jgi:hypothetical protein
MQNAAYLVPRWTVVRGALLLLLLGGSAPRAAHADSSDPGIECELQGGTLAEECGSASSVCVPKRCKTDADCGDGTTCKQVQACLGTSSCDASLVETVDGECDDQGTCGGKASCTREKLCFRRVLEKKDDGGCAVGAPRTAHGAGWMRLLGGVLVAVALRRRHARGIR